MFMILRPDTGIGAVLVIIEVTYLVILIDYL